MSTAPDTPTHAGSGRAGWYLATLGCGVWLLDALLLRGPVARVLLTLLVLALVVHLVVRRWAPHRLSPQWNEPVTVPQALLLLGTATSQLGLELDTRGAPTAVQLCCFLAGMAMLVASLVLTRCRR